MIHLCQVNHPKVTWQTLGKPFGVSKGAKEAIVTNHISSHLGVLRRTQLVWRCFSSIFSDGFFAEKNIPSNWGELLKNNKKSVLFLVLLLNCYRCFVHNFHVKTCQSAGLESANIVVFMRFL